VTILCLDISSTATGWATFAGKNLRGFGLIKPRGKDALDRIRDTVVQVLAVVSEEDAQEVYYERSDGKTHRRITKAANLSVLGEAQGSVATALRISGYPVHAVGTNEWTKGKRKETRARTVRMMFPAYFEWSAKDKGLDVADAIGLGVYVLGKLKTQELIAAGTSPRSR